MGQTVGLVPYIGRYIITSTYGGRVDPVTGRANQFHYGVDLVGLDEKVIHCTVYGTIDHVGWQNPANHQEGAGYYVHLTESGTGRTFWFMHMLANSALVSVGQKVAPGTPLGTEGSTGNVTGRHCHYQCGPSNQRGTVNILKIMGIPDQEQTVFTSTLSGVMKDPSAPQPGEAPTLPPYATQTTKGDATVREVAYLSSGLSPSIGMSNIKISAVNISDIVNAVKYLQPTRTTAMNYFNGSTSMAGSPRAVFEFLTGKGYPASSACGIMGNIEAESNFNTAAAGDIQHGVPTSFGLCQWHFGRGDNMKRMAGSDWANNLTGQLNYLDSELRSSYNGLCKRLMAEPVTIEGTRDAADKFVRMFEVPASVDQQSVIRQSNAVGFWNQLVV